MILTLGQTFLLLVSLWSFLYHMMLPDIYDLYQDLSKLTCGLLQVHIDIQESLLDRIWKKIGLIYIFMVIIISKSAILKFQSY